MSSDKVSLTEDFLVNLITTAKIKRQSFENSSLTTAYRLFNQDGDNLGGMTIDRYADFVVFSWYNTFIYEHRDVIISAFQKVYPDILGGYEKIRFKGLDYKSAHVYGQQAQENITILEKGPSGRIL